MYHDRGRWQFTQIAPPSLATLPLDSTVGMCATAAEGLCEQRPDSEERACVSCGLLQPGRWSGGDGGGGGRNSVHPGSAKGAKCWLETTRRGVRAVRITETSDDAGIDRAWLSEGLEREEGR